MNNTDIKFKKNNIKINNSRKKKHFFFEKMIIKKN